MESEQPKTSGFFQSFSASEVADHIHAIVEALSGSSIGRSILRAMWATAPFDRSKWYLEGASPEITAEEQRRVEVCEAYIRSAHWGPGTSENIKAAVAMNVRGAWPVAYTQGFKDGWRAAEEQENVPEVPL